MLLHTGQVDGYGTVFFQLGDWTAWCSGEGGHVPVFFFLSGQVPTCILAALLQGR